MVDSNGCLRHPKSIQFACIFLLPPSTTPTIILLQCAIKTIYPPPLKQTSCVSITHVAPPPHPHPYVQGCDCFDVYDPNGNSSYPCSQFFVVTCYLPIILVPLSVSFFSVFNVLFVSACGTRNTPNSPPPTLCVYLAPCWSHIVWFCSRGPPFRAQSQINTCAHLWRGALSVITQRYTHIH